MRYTDIDLNLHVNNIKYIEMIMDSFSMEDYENSLIKTITINFVTESKYDDLIELFKSADEENKYLIEGVNKSTSKVVFQADVELAKHI